MEVEVISIYFWTLPNLVFKSQTHWDILLRYQISAP